MKILYFYQYFSTPSGSWGTRVYEFTTEWVKQGHDVTVISSIYSKSDIKASKLIEDQLFNGVKVKVLNILIDNKQSFVKRIWSFFQYSLLSCWFALTLSADVVIASSGPITVGLPGLVARYIRGRKLVFETRDLWPEGAIELGIIKKKWLIKLAYWFEKKCYKASSLIVCLSPGMKSYIDYYHNHPNVISVTNAANIEMFSNEMPFNDYGILTAKKYAIYTGNIGPVNNSEWLLGAAIELKNKKREDIIILLIGDGQQRVFLEKEAKLNNIRNLVVWGLIPKTDLVPLIQNALVSLVPLKDTPVLDTSSPNKFFESLAAGVPVIQNTQGWMKDFLETYQVGFTLNPNDSISLAEKLIELADNPEKLDNLRNKAKAIAAKEFDKNVLAEKMLRAINTIV